MRVEKEPQSSPAVGNSSHADDSNGTESETGSSSSVGRMGGNIFTDPINVSMFLDPSRARIVRFYASISLAAVP